MSACTTYSLWYRQLYYYAFIYETVELRDRGAYARYLPDTGARVKPAQKTPTTAKKATQSLQFARQLHMCTMCQPFCRTTHSIRGHDSLTFMLTKDCGRFWHQSMIACFSSFVNWLTGASNTRYTHIDLEPQKNQKKNDKPMQSFNISGSLTLAGSKHRARSVKITT